MTSRHRGRPLFAAALVCALSGAFAAAADAPTDPLPGERGEMRTALTGSAVETLPVEYVGRLRDYLGPGYDLHVVRLTGPVAERVGVASGMSGSPVYFGGRLLGALSYRLAGGGLPSEAVGGVTPLEAMLAADTGRAGPGGDGGTAPISTPVTAVGLAPSLRAWLGGELAPFGFVLAAGGGSVAEDAAPQPLVPGAPLAVELVRGDLSIAAVGTVTWVDGENVYAFGHPFLGSGPVELPMAAAEVVITLPDLAGSVKLANVGREVGTIVEDRLTAVVGRRGREAHLAPVRLTIAGGDYSRREFAFEIGRSPRLLPMLTGLVVANALLGQPGHDPKCTLLVRVRLRLAGQPDLTVETALAADGAVDPALSLAGELQRLMGMLWLNPLAEVQVQGIDLDIDATTEVHSYRVTSLAYDRGPVHPGQVLELRCALQRYQGASETRTLRIEVPPDLSPGTSLLLAVGAPEQVDRLAGASSAQLVAAARDMASAIRALNRRRSPHRLTALLLRAAEGVAGPAGIHGALPPTATRLLARDGRGSSTSVTRWAALARSEVEMDGPVAGGVAAALVVDTRAVDAETESAPSDDEGEPR